MGYLPSLSWCWATPAAITYGTVLSGAQLNAKASVPGALVYSPAAGTVPAAGTDTLTLTFTPTDTTDYTTATDSVLLKVNPEPSFTLGASPASLSVAQGAFGESTITVTGQHGFTGSVTLAASGLPSVVRHAECRLSRRGQSSKKSADSEALWHPMPSLPCRFTREKFRVRLPSMDGPIRGSTIRKPSVIVVLPAGEPYCTMGTDRP